MNLETFSDRPPLGIQGANSSNDNELEKLEYEKAVSLLTLANEWENQRRRNFGMEYYEPNPMQLKAHKCMARRILYCGGNRAGKSTFGAMELVYHLTKRYPDWYPKEKRYNRPIKAVVSATEFPIVARVIEPKIFQFLPKDYYTFKRTAQGYLTQIKCKDGSTADILTSEMKDEAYESADWDFAWLDEPQQHRKYEAIMRGLVDRRGIMVITFTPLTEPWMKEDLVDRADGKTIACFTVDIRDNKFTVGGEPILSEDAIKEFEESISEEYRETRVHGAFFHMRGLIYKEFGEAHIEEETACKYNGRDPVIAVLDPHDRNPHHAIWAYIDKEDDIHIIKELIIHCELDDLAQAMLTVEKENKFRMRRRLIDPNFGRKPAAAGANYSVIQELHRNGIGFYEANDDVQLGHMLVRDALHYKMNKPVTAVNKPKLFFSRQGCPKTIRSMKNYQYQEWQGKTKEDKNPKEIEKDKDNHGADCVRYLVISRPRNESFANQEAKELESAPY